MFGSPAVLPAQESALVMSLIAGAICFVVVFLVVSLYEGSQRSTDCFWGSGIRLSSRTAVDRLQQHEWRLGDTLDRC